MLVVGAGVFGLAAALELRRRGHAVTVIDQGPIPHPRAASTDISKVIRLEYGADEAYTAAMEDARSGWLAWNDRWRDEGGPPRYHETGVLMVCHGPMVEGGFEYESWRTLRRRGHEPERLDARGLAERFPAWSTGAYVDGFYHAKGGFAESAGVVASLAGWARAAGVVVREGARMRSLLAPAHGVGVHTASGERLEAEHVVVATGAWTGRLLPGLSHCFRPSGQPVFHLRPAEPERFRAERFPTFTADVSRTGYYGFPLSRDGIVKVANHGRGRELDPDGDHAVTEDEHARMRAFLRESVPALADAPVVHTRVCLYSDTQDGHFWIAGDPDRAGVTVASGGSGHGFKFGPIVGPLIADAVEGRAHPLLDRFRWRPEVVLEHGEEAARFHGTGGPPSA